MDGFLCTVDYIRCSCFEELTPGSFPPSHWLPLFSGSLTTLHAPLFLVEILTSEGRTRGSSAVSLPLSLHSNPTLLPAATYQSRKAKKGQKEVKGRSPAQQLVKG